GTLVVQHVLHLPADLQQALVEAFDDHGRTRSAGWRLVVTSREPLERGRSDGRLLDHLYHLVAALTIRLPPLRDRRAELFDHVAAVLTKPPRGSATRSLEPAAGFSDFVVADDRSAAAGKVNWTLDAAAQALFLQYDWPGNLRELEAVLRQAQVRSATPTAGSPAPPLPGVLTPADFPRRLRRTEPTAADALPPTGAPPSLDALLEEVERRLLRTTLERCRGNKSKAADQLGVSRARMHRRLEQLGLTPAGADPPPSTDDAKPSAK
ncbi:MAG: helix-turn-helix domain-containing protein, partial [Planctomycetia bacterium]